MAIEACADLRGFFQGMVLEAMRRRRFGAEAETTEYVTDLLVACAGTDGAALLESLWARPFAPAQRFAMVGATGAAGWLRRNTPVTALNNPFPVRSGAAGATGVATGGVLAGRGVSVNNSPRVAG